MSELEIAVLSRLLNELTHGKQRLTRKERAEVVSIASGLCSKDAAAGDDVSPETVRARRKRIYSKLELGGAAEMISALLALALRDLGRNAAPVQHA